MNDISFIIPAYNAEKTLSRCLDSILELDLSIKYNVIVVDDGSNDRTSEICNSYKEKYSEVKVIKKENGGVSSARNKGLDESQSKWVVFVDSDDWLLPGFKEISNYCMYSNADVIFFDYKTENKYVINNDTESYSVLPTELTRETVIKSTLDYENPQNVRTRFNSPWAKVFNSKIIGDNNRFDVRISVAEDFIFNLGVYTNAEKFEYLSIPGYAYYVNVNSVTRSRRTNIVENNIIVCQEFEKLKKNLNVYPWFENAYYYSVLKGFLNIIFLKFINGMNTLLSKEEKKEILKLKSEELYSFAFDHYPEVADRFNKRHKLILNSLYHNSTLALQGLIVYNLAVKKLRK